MQRDMDVIRTILLKVRDADRAISAKDLPSINAIVFARHVQLMEEAGLCCCSIRPDSQGLAVGAIVFRLTWAGYDFAESITDDSIWQSAKDRVIKPAASWTFDILKAYLKSEISRHIPGF